MSSQTSGSSWSFRIRETWRSVLSWMHWSQRRQARLELERELLLLQQRVMVRQLLWEMALPLAEALGRLDYHQQLTRKRVQVMQQQQVEMRNRQEELLLEILQAQQLSAEQQMFPLIGLPTQPHSPPSSAS